MKSEQLRQLVKKAVKTEFKLDIEPQIDYAPTGKGDFATNAAFEISGGKNPIEAAKKLALAIKGQEIDKAEAAGPYVNITLKAEAWKDELKSVGPKYGHRQSKGQKVQVEFISANPTGPLTIGNARGGFIGDVLSTVLETQGHKVTREYYFNDAGTQVMKLVDSARIAAGIADGVPEYKGEYLAELAEEFKNDLEKSDMEVAATLTGAIRERYIEPAVNNMNIEVGHWFNERELIESGEYQRLEKELLDKAIAVKRDGAVWAVSTKFGDDRDRVLRKSNGDVSYLGTDLAYHRNIFEKRGFNRAIKVLGADHSGQTLSLKVMVENGLKINGQLEFLVYQFVRLIKDGHEVKMGKRVGTYVTTDELIEEVGPDVARFFFLLRSADSHMDFDLDLAKEESQKNPYWYVMYAYVRSQSILGKAKDKGLLPGRAIARVNSKELELVRQISRWPSLLAETAESFEVHKLAFFGQEIAKLFHDYYEDTKIIDLPSDVAKEKLYFVQQIGLFFENYFSVLGIKPVKKM